MRRLFAVGAIGSLFLTVFAAMPVLAAELTGGCVLEVRSFSGPNATGNRVDEGGAAGVMPEGTVGSQSRPFKVDPEGSIDFLFSTSPTVFQNNTWSIYAQGIPIPLLSGSDDNPLDVDERGVVSVAELVKQLPFQVVGTFFITGDLYGNDNANHCHGEGYVQLLGDAPATPLWMLAAALLALGAVGLLVATPYSTTWETDPNSGERLRSGPVTS